MGEVNFRAKFIQNYSSLESATLPPARLQEFLKHYVLDPNSNIDMPVLFNVIAKNTLPLKQRFEVWKVVLEISSQYSAHRKAIDDCRLSEATHAYKTTRLFFKEKVSSQKNDTKIPEEPSTSLTNSTTSIEQQVIAVKPEDRNIFYMVLHTRPKRTRGEKPNKTSEDALRCIVMHIYPQCEKYATSNFLYWVDAYWIIKRIDNLLESKFPTDKDILKMKKFYESVKLQVSKLQKQHTAECLKIKKPTGGYIITDAIMILWFRSGGSNWLRNKTILKFWDKLIMLDNIELILREVYLDLLESTFAFHLSTSSSNTEGLAISLILPEDKEQKIVLATVKKLYTARQVSFRKEDLCG
uniref:Rab-GAP TBC domain-containing protein n=1 Tax=Rhabditophanes sp. KR3021 TaxID=114890 RepID=A0AC35TPS0_9BILA